MLDVTGAKEANKANRSAQDAPQERSAITATATTTTENSSTNRRGFDFLSLSTYLLLLFLVSKYLLLYASTLKLKWLRPEGLVMIDCFRGAWRRGAGLSEPGRSGAGPRAYWRGSRHRGARRTCNFNQELLIIRGTLTTLIRAIAFSSASCLASVFPPC